MRILGVGAAIIDILVSIEEDFLVKHNLKKGDSVMSSQNEIKGKLSQIVTEPKIMAGGSVANTIRSLEQLGEQNGRFISLVGEDKFGSIFQSSFKSSLVGTTKEMATGICLSLITPDGQRTMMTDLGASQCFYEQEMDASILEDFDHLHLEAYTLFNRDFFYNLIKKAKEKSMSISLDLSAISIVETFGDSLPSLLKDYIDILLVNEEEAIAFTGKKEVAEAMNILVDYCPTVCYKQGIKGAYLFIDGQLHHAPAYKVDDVRDSTGAGDLWAAGFFYATINKLSYEKRILLANFLGAETIKNIGAFVSIEQINKTKELI